MIKSMTAFARTETGDALRSVVVEIRPTTAATWTSFCACRPPMPVWKTRSRLLVAAAVARGRVEVRLQIEAKTEEAVVFAVNAPRVVAYHRALTELKKLVNIDTPVTLEQLVGMGDMIKPAEGENDVSSFWPLIEESLGRALSDLDTMRRREGEYIATDIGRRIDGIAHILEQVETAANGLLEKYRDRLQERISALTDGIIAIDGDRIMQEAAILAERSDITEEIVRAASPTPAQFRSLMLAEEPAGRKLNFLMQELNREFNTIGSKTDTSAIAHMVVDVKAELEKIREQVQNVE